MIKVNLKSVLISVCLLLVGCGLESVIPEQSGVGLNPPPVSEPLPEHGTVVELNNLKAGTCGSPAPGATLIEAIQVDSCDQPHNFEVSGVLQRTESLSDPYPGRILLEYETEKACREPFETHTGKVYGDLGSVLDVQSIPPSALTWGDGDRTVICLIITRDGSPLERPAADY